MWYSASDTQQQTVLVICCETEKRRNAFHNDNKQLQQIAITDQQTKINQNSYEFSKLQFPLVKAYLYKYIWQVCTVNSTAWSIAKITWEGLKKKSAEDAF